MGAAIPAFAGMTMGANMHARAANGQSKVYFADAA